MSRKCVITLVLVIFMCCSFVGCGVHSPYYAIDVGAEQQIVGDETLKVVSAELCDGKIIVTMDTNFDDIKLADFKYITVKKTEVDAPEIECDISASCELNDRNIFDAPYKGEVTLVFYGDSITSNDDLTSYCLDVGYCTEDGVMPNHRFLLEPFTSDS